MSSDDLFLSDLSQKDKPWDRHRIEADQVLEIYKGTEFHAYFERMSKCSQLLIFALVSGDLGELAFKLLTAWFCRVRHCPVCQWRRSLKLKGQFLEAMPKIQQDYPTARFVFLTLTVKNPPIQELRSTLDRMNKAWIRLTQRKQFPALGWVKSVEVTRPREEPGMCHPHFHALLMVPAGYFGSAGGYLSKDKWIELWQKSLRVDYAPSIDVQAVKPRKGNNMASAINEVMKYSVKPQDLLEDSEWLLELTKQLHNTRAIAVGGVFRRYLSDEEPENLVNVNEEPEDAEPVTDEEFEFGWRQRVKRYAYNKSGR